MSLLSKILLSLIISSLMWLNVWGSSIDMAKLPAGYREFLSSINVDKIGNSEAISEIVVVSPNLVKIKLTFDLDDRVLQDDWQKDYGFTMENYGRTSPEGEGVGEFTTYDWENGAASEAYNRILDKYKSKLLK